MSDMFQDPMFIRQMIMDHYEYPRNKELVNDDSYGSKHMDSESCIDDITVQVKVVDDVIEDVRFDGIACTISTSSTSIMTDLLKGKTISEADYIIENYYKMLQEKEFDQEVLKGAIVFQNVSQQANRINCATIGWDAVHEILEESRETNE